MDINIVKCDIFTVMIQVVTHYGGVVGYQCFRGLCCQKAVIVCNKHLNQSNLT